MQLAPEGRQELVLKGFEPVVDRSRSIGPNRWSIVPNRWSRRSSSDSNRWSTAIRTAVETLLEGVEISFGRNVGPADRREVLHQGRGRVGAESLLEAEVELVARALIEHHGRSSGRDRQRRGAITPAPEGCLNATETGPSSRHVIFGDVRDVATCETGVRFPEYTGKGTPVGLGGPEPALADEFHAQAVVVPLGHLGEAGEGPGGDAAGGPQVDAGVEEAGQAERSGPVVEDPLEAGHAGLEQRQALLVPLRPFGVAQRGVAVELVEAELGVDLVDVALVVGGDFPVGLLDAGQELPSIALNPCRLVAETGRRRREDGRTPAGAEEAAGLTVGGPPAGVRSPGRPMGICRATISKEGR